MDDFAMVLGYVVMAMAGGSVVLGLACLSLRWAWSACLESPLIWHVLDEIGKHRKSRMLRARVQVVVAALLIAAGWLALVALLTSGGAS